MNKHTSDAPQKNKVAWLLVPVLIIAGWFTYLELKNSNNADKSVKGGTTETALTHAPADADAKMKSLQDVIHAMEQDGMKTVNKLYPDLTLVKSVKNGESENIGGMGDEDWMYSKSYDITVAVCAHMNTPAYVFKGTTLSATELAKAKSTSTEMAAMTTAKGTSYQNYSEAVMNSALKSGQKVIVFFHAEWCATCRALEANIKANLTQIPANVLILQANFDTETALKQKYGITVKTSFAVLNADGSLEKKLVGPKDLQEILK